MKLLPIAAMSLWLGACTARHEPLEVRQFKLRDQQTDYSEDPMVRMEKQRRLRGAVSLEERRQRLGQYFTVLWDDAGGSGKGPVELVFEYRQGGSASRIKRQVRAFASESASGEALFEVIGDDYLKGGRVLAWQATLRRDGATVATRRSYLWR